MAVFHRASDLLSTGPSVSEREVVNVLGRWKTYLQWNQKIGGLAQLDKMDLNSPWTELVVDGRTGKLRRPATEEEKAMRTPARSPQRRAWCQKRGLAQRYWHNANVGLLPFKDSAMAKSVGATVGELSKEPISPLACEVVFDAISDGQGGIVEYALCDERRASYQRPDGSFDAEAFGSAINKARRTVAIGYAIYPGILNAIFLYVGYRIDALGIALGAADDFIAGLERSWETAGASSLAAPALLAAAFLYSIQKPEPVVDSSATEIRFQTGERTARLKK